MNEVKVTKRSGFIDLDDLTLDEAIQKLENLKQEGCPGDAVIEFGRDYEGDIRFRATFTRPETETEARLRIEAEEDKAAREKEARRKLLKELKDEFGDAGI